MRRLLDSLFRSGIGVATAGLLLAGLEGTLRLVRFDYQKPSPIIMWHNEMDREIKHPQGRVRFHPYWFWKLRPGTRGVPDCPDEQINAGGFRGPDRPQAPIPSRLRIAVLGDSSTFGLGVCQDETYAALLERELPGAEVLNFGMVGYTAFQGEKLLEGRVLAYRPTVILAAFGAVNESSPALGHDVDAKFAITSQMNPTLISWSDRLSDLRIFQLVQAALGRRPDHKFLQQAGENWNRWNRGSQDYVRTQSVASFERSLERIVQLGRSHGARVALIRPPLRVEAENRWPWVNEYSMAIARVASRLTVPHWDVRAAFRGVPNGDETLLQDYYHPNAAGHRLYARFLAERMRHDLVHPESDDTASRAMTR